MAFKIAFDVNGTIHEVSGITKVKMGNSYLRCMGNVSGNDDALAALIPLDSVAYVVHESLTVSTSTLDATTAGDEAAL